MLKLTRYVVSNSICRLRDEIYIIPGFVGKGLAPSVKHQLYESKNIEQTLVCISTIFDLDLT